ncbi:MAG: beta-ketoacyl-ACP synthase 3 [Phycisphaerales bacterium]|jgi:3-oxoacyl-[acyl-carrier-protein] synthase-3|nr:beta-ketoacyl-ACP synthase 3 [Phycisphaerales bacterium]
MTTPCGVRLLGTGSAVPETILDNETLAKRFGVDADWIEQRSGIRERRVCGRGESVFTLELEALRNAMDNASVQPTDLSLIITASVTSEMTCPSNASRLGGAIGAVPTGGFDLVAACCGFVSAMNVADSLIRAGGYETIAVVGGDCMTGISDMHERGSAILFGDAAGCAILQRSDTPTEGCIYQRMNGDGTDWSSLYIPNRLDEVVEDDGFDVPLGKLRMKGKEVYKFAVNTFQDLAVETMANTQLAVEDIAQFICHQSNARIIESAMQKLSLPSEKVYINIDRYGNSSSGSVSLCLDQLWRNGSISRGDTIVMLAFGGGLTWTSSVWNL